MDGCVPDSIKYVPARGAFQVSGVAVAPAKTSVENDCTRGPCTGGLNVAPGVFAIGHVGVSVGCSGAGVVVRCFTSPRPPPSCPTITSEVGTEFAPKERLFVRLIVRSCPVGTVITTGDQPAAAGIDLAQVAVEPPTGVPQL